MFIARLWRFFRLWRVIDADHQWLLEEHALTGHCRIRRDRKWSGKMTLRPPAEWSTPRGDLLDRSRR